MEPAQIIELLKDLNLNQRKEVVSVFLKEKYPGITEDQISSIVSLLDILFKEQSRTTITPISTTSIDGGSMKTRKTRKPSKKSKKPKASKKSKKPKEPRRRKSRKGKH